MNEFDDALLECPSLMEHEGLRWIAGAGARVRRMGLQAPLGRLSRSDRPRGILIVGPEARLIRAVLEPACPVPFMAWQGPTLPAWVGPLDLVVIVDDEQPGSALLDVGAESARRGATLLVATRDHSLLAEVTASAEAMLVPANEHDATASAIALLALLGQLGLGPAINLELVADALDLVAQECSPQHDLSVNPGKQLALALADHQPLVWGGTVLANRAGRRFAEAIRRGSGVPALAADALELIPVLRAVEPRDPFADLEDDESLPPVLVLLDADKAQGLQARFAATLRQHADARGVRVAPIASGAPGYGLSDVEAYVMLLARALYGATYVQIGHGR